MKYCMNIHKRLVILTVAWFVLSMFWGQKFQWLVGSIYVLAGPNCRL
jgi:hypothetical protein